jgi:hypothetical protein
MTCSIFTFDLIFRYNTFMIPPGKDFTDIIFLSVKYWDGKKIKDVKWKKTKNCTTVLCLTPMSS